MLGNLRCLEISFWAREILGVLLFLASPRTTRDFIADHSQGKRSFSG